MGFVCVWVFGFYRVSKFFLFILRRSHPIWLAVALLEVVALNSSCLEAMQTLRRTILAATCSDERGDPMKPMLANEPQADSDSGRDIHTEWSGWRLSENPNHIKHITSAHNNKHTRPSPLHLHLGCVAANIPLPSESKALTVDSIIIIIIFNNIVSSITEFSCFPPTLVSNWAKIHHGPPISWVEPYSKCYIIHQLLRLANFSYLDWNIFIDCYARLLTTDGEKLVVQRIILRSW